MFFGQKQYASGLLNNKAMIEQFQMKIHILNPMFKVGDKHRNRAVHLGFETLTVIACSEELCLLGYGAM
jgi:hypothetical protein